MQPVPRSLPAPHAAAAHRGAALHVQHAHPDLHGGHARRLPGAIHGGRCLDDHACSSGSSWEALTAVVTCMLVSQERHLRIDSCRHHLRPACLPAALTRWPARLLPTAPRLMPASLSTQLNLSPTAGALLCRRGGHHRPLAVHQQPVLPVDHLRAAPAPLPCPTCPAVCAGAPDGCGLLPGAGEVACCRGGEVVRCLQWDVEAANSERTPLQRVTEGLLGGEAHAAQLVCAQHARQEGVRQRWVLRSVPTARLLPRCCRSCSTPL